MQKRGVSNISQAIEIEMKRKYNPLTFSRRVVMWYDEDDILYQTMHLKIQIGLDFTDFSAEID